MDPENKLFIKFYRSFQNFIKLYDIIQRYFFNIRYIV